MAPFKIEKSWKIAKKILHLLLLYVNVNVGRQLYIDSYEAVSYTHLDVYKRQDKSYPGDNRLISPKSPHRRGGLAPRCRLIASWS